MTIICYRDGIMAADSGIYQDGLLVGLHTPIVKVPGGSLTVAVGSPFDIHRYAQWVVVPTDENDEPFVGAEQPGFHALMVTPDKVIFTVDGTGATVELDAPFATIGTGWKMAYGAMAAGATAERAVQIAIEFHDGCHGPVQLAKVGDHG